jgi:tetratricopeptide (TPR) repeat protein
MDEASLEKLGTMLIGVSVAGVALAGAGVPPGILEGGVAGAGLFLRLKGQRRSDADAVLRNLKQVIRQGSNLGDFVDEVLRRVAALAAHNQYDTAAQEIDAALEQEQADSTARRLRLLDAGIAQDILRRDPESAARRLIQKADLEAAGAATVATLRALQDEWHERGRDQGLNFDLAIAIALSTLTLPRANGPDDRGTVLNDLGTALATLGEREAGTTRLEQAVAAFRAALTERRQDRAPLDWAMTQNNLGAAVQTLGAREAGTERLEQAVKAYRAALTEHRQDRVPLDWAMTQMNLGTALLTLGAREAGTARLEQAVEAFRAALTELTQDRVPLDWASTLGNEGLALLTLAGRTGDAARARQALDQLTLAEATLRSGGHIPWADYYAGQIPDAQSLVDRLSGGPP